MAYVPVMAYNMFLPWPGCTNLGASNCLAAPVSVQGARASSAAHFPYGGMRMQEITGEWYHGQFGDHKRLLEESAQV